MSSGASLDFNTLAFMPFTTFIYMAVPVTQLAYVWLHSVIIIILPDLNTSRDYDETRLRLSCQMVYGKRGCLNTLLPLLNIMAVSFHPCYLRKGKSKSSTRVMDALLYSVCANRGCHPTVSHSARISRRVGLG